MRVFVAGTWNEEKASKFAPAAHELGKQLALGGFDLGCGPGTGVSRHVIRGYRSVDQRGKVTFYLPTRADMERVGEIVGEGADSIVQTDLDYPMRNIYQIRAADAVCIVTGGDGTLEEAVVALADYQLPVAALRGSGIAVDALELLLPLFPQWGGLLKIASDVETLVDYVASRIGSVPRAHLPEERYSAVTVNAA